VRDQASHPHKATGKNTVLYRPGVQKSRGPRRPVLEFRTVAPGIFGIIIALHTKMRISLFAPSIMRQITARFTGHSRIVGPQNGPCFM
jgi:hypothetical protein